MYNEQLIQNAFVGLVGLRQTDNPEFPKLDSSLLYTGNNVLVHNSLLNIENIDMSARNYSFFNYNDYQPVTEYFIDDRIKYNDVVYKSLTGVVGSPNVGNQPDISPSDWEEVNLLSLYIEDVYKSAVSDTVNGVFREKKINRQTKTLLQNQRMTDGVGSFGDYIMNEGNLVGVEIKLKTINNVKAVINKIGLQISQANPAFKMYLYHSSQIEPIQEITFNQSKASSFQWHSVETELNYNSDNYDVGGVFYLMYDQNDLIGSAIKKKHNWHLPPCQYCNRSEVDYFNKYTKYLSMRTVQVNASDRDGVNLWNIEKTKYVSDNNFGLNFEWTIQCDLTAFIIQKKRGICVCVEGRIY